MILCSLLALTIGGASLIGSFVKGTFASVHSGPTTGDAATGSGSESEVVLRVSEDLIYMTSEMLLALAGGLAFILLMLRISRRRVEAEEKENEAELQREHVAVMREPQSQVLAKVLAKRNRTLSQLEGSWAEILHGQGVVESYMSRDVYSVEPELCKDEALMELQRLGYRRCMVTDAEGHLVGVVSKKDIVCKEGTSVADVMTSNPRIAKRDTGLHIALSVLLENRISCLPVVDRGLLVGVISTSDMLMVLQCLLVEVQAHAEDIPPESLAQNMLSGDV